MAVSSKPDTSTSTVRLPCRGCTANCGNYAICQGKPWKKEMGGVKDH